MPPATFLLAVLVAVVEVVVVVGATATVDAEEAGEVDGGGRSFISDRSPSANDDDDSLRPLLFLSSGNKLRVISYGDSSSAVDSSPSSPPLADDGSGENSAVRPGCL